MHLLQVTGLAKVLVLDAAEGLECCRRVLLLDLRDEVCFAACHINGGMQPAHMSAVKQASCTHLSSLDLKTF